MAIGITTGLLDWKFQNAHVERVMDNAAYQAAHPDDTLVLAGPARMAFDGGSGAASNSTLGTTAPDAAVRNTLLAIGMLQSVNFSQSKPTQPMMAIGSGRSFFVSGKAQTQWTIGRLFVNGRNLLRVLSHNAVAAGVQAHEFDDPAATTALSNFFTNLDSELYYIPFGMGALFRNKAHDLIGSFYAELCMINSYSIGMNAGQNMMLENVTGLADRLLPFNDVIASAGANADSGNAWDRATVDEVLNFSASTPGNYDTINTGVQA